MKNSMPMPTPHSGPVKKLVHNATRTSKASPSSMQITQHSGSRSDVAGNDGIGMPYAKASDRAEQKMGTSPMIIPHSPVAVPRSPKKWNKQKMSAGVATSLDD